METGKIKFWLKDRGFGFITAADGGPDVFLHVKECQKAKIHNPAEGMAVQFEAAPGRDGKPKAVRVELAR